MSLDYADALARSRPGRAFSNGTEWDIWSDNWCYRPCLRDLPYQNDLKGATGCPLIALAMVEERTPAEWMEQPDDSPDRYVCLEFKAPGGGGEPKPRPTPPDQDALFDRPPTRSRMLTPLPEDRPLRTLETVGGVL